MGIRDTYDLLDEVNGRMITVLIHLFNAFGETIKHGLVFRTSDPTVGFKSTNQTSSRATFLLLSLTIPNQYLPVLAKLNRVKAIHHRLLLPFSEKLHPILREAS